MNAKLLFPTYRNRYLFVENSLREIPKKARQKVLHLGCGEGDYDPMLAGCCLELVSVDINESDVNYARQLNAGLPNVHYQTANALNLDFEDNSFDGLVSVDTLEHVGQPELMIREISRVLKPGAWALLTFPQLNFPITYDPINKWLMKDGQPVIHQGAFAFGHEYLIEKDQFEGQAQNAGLTTKRVQYLSHTLVAFLEMYWTGWIQAIFKANAKNSTTVGGKSGIRPGQGLPPGQFLTDALIKADRLLFGNNNTASVGLGVHLIKEAV